MALGAALATHEVSGLADGNGAPPIAGDDANHAGTAKSKDCTLIITEGDSAKSLAMAGLSVVGRDYYGVFPLKGKVEHLHSLSSSFAVNLIHHSLISI